MHDANELPGSFPHYQLLEGLTSVQKLNRDDSGDVVEAETG
ncbi:MULTISPECIES: hypothetical protein [unclassified Caballeronia]|nr:MULTISPECIES: hypothetical protein [unclassified Caballeronia]